MELFRLFGSIIIDDKHALKALKEASGSATKTESVFSKLGKTIKTALSVAAVVGFSKKAIEAAADAEALGQQFEATFGKDDNIENMEKAMADLSKETNIAAGRFKGASVQIYSFAKASEATADEALDLTTRALASAADTAAFYDISLEEATERTMSFMKGAYANDAALGISATEFTRNAKAVELFGKKFNDLDEIQKQDTLLKMIEDGQELSGALGQAAREGDAFENVMGNLKYKWEQFLTVAGGPLLAVFLEGLKLVNGLLDGLISFVDRLKTGVTEVFSSSSDEVSILTEAFNTLSPIIALLGNIFEDVLYYGILLVVEIVQFFIGILSSFSEALTPLSDDLIPRITNALSLFKDKISEAYDIVSNYLNKALEDLQPYIQWLADKFEELYPKIEKVITDGLEILSNVAGEVAQVLDWLSQNLDIVIGLFVFFAAALGIYKLIGLVQAAMLAYNTAGSAMAVIQGLLNATMLASPIFWIAVGIAAVVAAIVVLAMKFEGFRDFLVVLFEFFKTLIGTALTVIVELVKLFFNTIMVPLRLLWNIIKVGVGALIDIIGPVVNLIMSIVTVAISVITSAIKVIQVVVKTVLGTVSNIFGTIFGSIKTVVVGVLTFIKNAFIAPFKFIVDLVRKQIDKVKNFLNFKWSFPKLKLPHFKIEGSVNPLKWFTQGVPKVKVDWYATGGIFDSPTIFATPFGYKGVGEAGPEVVAPISALQKYLDNSFATAGSEAMITKETMEIFAGIVSSTLFNIFNGMGISLDKRQMGQFVREVA